MAFRQVARKPEVFDVDWGDRFNVLPWTEDKTADIAQFLLSAGTQSFAELVECEDGTPASAQHYVTRAREYVKRELDGDEVGYASSSLVYDTTHGQGSRLDRRVHVRSRRHPPRRHPFGNQSLSLRVGVLRDQLVPDDTTRRYPLTDLPCDHCPVIPIVRGTRTLKQAFESEN